jgi:hypothetical protein
MSNLIVCCDGTWNDKKNSDDSVLAPTNVFQLFNALELNHGEIKQFSLYQEGVGTEGGLDKFTGGMLGHGLGEDIRDCYQWLSTKYTAGDKIYLFGFSRGAFTARSLAGLIGKYGIAKSDFSVDFESRIKSIYREGYRNNKQLPEDWFFTNSTKVKLVGVWDTVGALGIPDDKILLNMFGNSKKYKFHDTKLGKHIENGRHALAADEKRGSFSPTLWDLDESDNRVKQIWFPGVHSDVGGGYKENGLSNCALKWMVDEAQALGVKFKEKSLKQISPNPQDVIHDSHIGFMKILITCPRTLPNITDTEKFSDSFSERRNSPPIGQVDYLPIRAFEDGKSIEIDIYAKQQWNWTGIHLEKGKTYKFKATGQWTDSTISCAPQGMSDGDFHIGEIAHIAGSLMGKLEQGWKFISGNESADAFGSKRFEHADWFSLIGAVADGGNPDIDGTHEPITHFEIGNGAEFTPEESGYLHCFANDAWGFYGNNRGFVSLDVTEVPRDEE